MNVASSTASTASTTDVSSTQTTSKASTSSKTSEKSFDEEMKTQTEDVQDTQKTAEENSVSDKKSDQKSEKDLTEETNKLTQELKKETDELVTSEMLSGSLNFTDFKYHNESQTILNQNIQNLLNTKDLMSTVNSAITVDYDAINMSDNDATFFANLVKTGEVSMDNLASQLTDVNNTQSAKSVQVSSVLMDKLAESLKTNQPFRIDFDKDVSVIIKVNKDGSIAANFIPGDKAVEQYLRNNIGFLKQRFDDENLSYSQLSYSNSRNQQQKQQNKKENDNE